MTDRAVLALAAAVGLGAWCSSSVRVPLALAMGVVVLALVVRRPALMIAGGALLAASLGQRAWAGLVPPARGSPVTAEVELLSDPVEVRGALKVDVALGRRRAEAWARGPAASALRPRLAGERVVVEGRLRPPPADARRWLAQRHVSARLSIDQVGAWTEGGPVTRLANGLRRTLSRGAEPLDNEGRALLTGFVLGDDREQSDAVAADFRAAGLTHLLAVSGQNVAFVLVLFRPALSRLGIRGRWAASLAVIAFFGSLTRWEPSVIRASAMAALACTATGLGRPASRARLLALAVAGSVLVDPLLVHSLGFQLSVGATAAIVLFAGPLARHIRGPRCLAEALAVTLAAQVGVAPILIPVFGGLPLASIPANLLAVPAAAPLMVWGLTAGLVAGVTGPPVDALLHLPTSWLTGWVAGVARRAAGLPLGQVELVHLVALVAVGVATVVAVRYRPRLVVTGAVVAGLVVLVLAIAPSGGDLNGWRPAPGAELWRAGSVVLVLDDADGGRVLEGLRAEGVGTVDVVVVRRGTRPSASTVALLRSRLDVGTVLAPEGHVIRDAAVPAVGAQTTVGDIRLRVTAIVPTLEVEVVLA